MPQSNRHNHNNRRATQTHAQTHAPPVPPEIRPEVQAAVDDMIAGSSIDSVSEWLQREFQRLMHREAAVIQHEAILAQREASHRSKHDAEASSGIG